MQNSLKDNTSKQRLVSIKQRVAKPVVIVFIVIVAVIVVCDVIVVLLVSKDKCYNDMGAIFHSTYDLLFECSIVIS